MLLFSSTAYGIPAALGISVRLEQAQANLITRNAAISACEKGARWELALDMLLALLEDQGQTS